MMISRKTGESTFYQVSLLQALALGDYHGHVSIGKLRANGDIGIGTFDGLDGEMVMLDGIVYKVSGDGSLSVVDDDETTPFANVTFFRNDFEEDVPASSISELGETLSDIVGKGGINSIHMIRMHGLFDTIVVRSVAKQKEPYDPLAITLKERQNVFTYDCIAGTIVGVYCPAYMRTINNQGWHLHFISDDRRFGGHVLDVRTSDAVCSFMKIDKLELVIPDTEHFHSLDLAADQEEDIKKIESAR